MDEPKITITIPKRWLQFRLRSLLLLMLLLAIALPFLVDRPKPSVAAVAMEGYCSVSLRDLNQWALGNPKYVAAHDGLTYYFVGARERDAFIKNPAKYSLAAAGIDVVVAKRSGQVVLGARRYGYRYFGRTFLFSDPASMNEFAAAPGTFAKFADQWDRKH